MSQKEIADAIRELPEMDRLDLARQIIAGIVADQAAAGEISQAIHGIEDVARASDPLTWITRFPGSHGNDRRSPPIQ